ncbi:MAG: hypothetical protein PWP31_1767 [Clostridia bacterium]|nr:hypothetical protein [Clostridia bacterium]
MELRDVMTLSEAARMYNLSNGSVIRKAISRGQFIENIEVRKSGDTWLVTKQGMDRIYGYRRYPFNETVELKAVMSTDEITGTPYSIEDGVLLQSLEKAVRVLATTGSIILTARNKKTYTLTKGDLLIEIDLENLNIGDIIVQSTDNCYKDCFASYVGRVKEINDQGISVLINNNEYIFDKSKISQLQKLNLYSA